MEKTIDQLIKEAPEHPDGTTDYFVKYKTYNLINEKAALRKFKKCRFKNPRRPAGRKTTRRLNKRVTGDEICYTTPYIPRKVTKLPEYSFSEQYYGAYFDGFYTNNFILIKMDRPKTKKPLQDGQDHHRAYMSSVRWSALMPVEVYKETYNFMDENPMPRAHFKGHLELEINAALLDVVYEYHPEATARTDKKIICFYVDQDLVAIIGCLKKR